MSIPETNPFRPTRWEHHGSDAPLIWFTPTAQLLSEDKSVYVHGSRGSGKTTLLKSICWDELAHNESLTLQRSIGDFRHIGIYVRLPDHVAASMGGSDWELIVPDAYDWQLEFFRFFSLAVELICAEKALLAVHTLRLESKLELSAESELLLVKDIVEEFEKISSFSAGPVRTFAELARVFRNLVRAMNEASGRGQTRHLLAQLPVREPLDLLNFVIRRLSVVARLTTSRGGVSPGFKFCLDDCEVVSDLQAKCINTLVRKSRFPASWVICWVGDEFNLFDTFIPTQPLTDADRKVVSLDGRAIKEFHDLCQAVASLRVYYAIPESSRPIIDRANVETFFPLIDRLGATSVNSIIGQMVSRSTSIAAQELQEATFILRSNLRRRAKKYATKYPENGSEMPYYEAYILARWDGLEDSFSAAPDNDRLARHASKLSSASFQAWLRRKMVAALLQISTKLGFRRLPLAGANMIVSLSDGSIRDFLETMAEIYERYATDRNQSANDERLIIERFATSRTKIAQRMQTDGIYASSEAFLRGISSANDTRPDALSRLVEGLGQLTHMLQSSTNVTQALSTAERGVFVFDMSKGMSLDSRKAIYRTIQRAELSGYLRGTTVARRNLAERDGEKKKATGYRLHRRFAPHFHFSYRGAYEIVHLGEEQIARLCASTTEPVIEWARQIAARLSPERLDQLTLFDQGPYIDE